MRWPLKFDYACLLIVRILQNLCYLIDRKNTEVPVTLLPQNSVNLHRIFLTVLSLCEETHFGPDGTRLKQKYLKLDTKMHKETCYTSLPLLWGVSEKKYGV